MTQTMDTAGEIIQSLGRRAARMELALNAASESARQARENGDAVTMRNAFEAQLMAQVRWEEADLAHGRAIRIRGASQS